MDNQKVKQYLMILLTVISNLSNNYKNMQGLYFQNKKHVHSLKIRVVKINAFSHLIGFCFKTDMPVVKLM